VKRIDSPTPWVLIQPRAHIYVDGKVDGAAAKKILDAIKPVGLSEFMGKPALPAPRYDYPAPQAANPDLLHPEREPRQGQGGKLAPCAVFRSVLSHSTCLCADAGSHPHSVGPEILASSGGGARKVICVQRGYAHHAARSLKRRGGI
jgi:hypothetical protein